MRSYLLSIGIMTGNSLDGVDLVLTKFDLDGSINDLCSHSLKSTKALADALRLLGKIINDNSGNMEASVLALDNLKDPAKQNIATALIGNGNELNFDTIENAYTEFIARGVKELINKAKSDKNLASQHDNFDQIDLIGSHGQTRAHCPPSIAKTKNLHELYTVQIGDGQKLANLTGITTVCDFRSDDLMNGGEAAPLAPMHHMHLSVHAKKSGNFPIAFCNAGNTGNISIISEDSTSEKLAVIGFDVGPFNHFPDSLLQSERNLDCDFDGKIGYSGNVNIDLLKILFDKAAITKDGENFITKAPPKSSDPTWYVMPDELSGKAKINSNILSFEDRLRTAEYFSAYIYFYSLSLLPETLKVPGIFALCGGGWKNPVITGHFRGLLKADFGANPVLPEHLSLFREISEKVKDNKKIECEESSHYGYDGTAMEARIFADAAVARIKGEAFTLPETTNVSKPTICGIIKYKDSLADNASETFKKWLDKFNSKDLTTDKPDIFDSRWSRASAGWAKKLGL